MNNNFLLSSKYKKKCFVVLFLIYDIYWKDTFHFFLTNKEKMVLQTNFFAVTSQVRKIYILRSCSSKFHNGHSTFKKWQKWQKKWQKMKKNLVQKNFSAKNRNFQQIWLRKMQFWGEIFFSFLTRNHYKFLVTREKSNCEKNATH